MVCDMVVALGQATACGWTLFGHNCGLRSQERLWVQRLPGRQYAPGEHVQTLTETLPQTRQTVAVLGVRTDGLWGFYQGVNEYGVAVGMTRHGTQLSSDRPGLLGTDLVRLALERSSSAFQAMITLTDLIDRYGQRVSPGGPTGNHADTAFLVADAREAFALEAAGHHWVCQEVRELRAMSDASTVRQDWNRIAHGLASHAIEHGWWPSDGSKLDFAGALTTHPGGLHSGLRRWARTTFLLQEQNGHVDTPFLRRLLSDHGEEDTQGAREREPIALCHHAGNRTEFTTAGSLVAELDDPARRCPLVWIAVGPPCETVYLPLCLAADPPAALGHPEGAGSEQVFQRLRRLQARAKRDSAMRGAVQEGLLRLQARLDQEAEDFAMEFPALRERAAEEEASRQAGLFMQHALELLEEVTSGLSNSLSISRAAIIS